MFVELGAAILSSVRFGKPLIYVVGDNLGRSIFYYHPSVKLVKNIAQVLEEIDNLAYI
ncbi:MAG: hypothetical protein ABIH72_05270 [archaeon]